MDKRKAVNTNLWSDLLF